MFFATPAFAQTAAGAPTAMDALSPFLLPIGLFVLFYFMILRPQQQRMKKHQAMLGAVKRGDTVVLSSGVIGKVSKVEDAEVTVDIAANTSVRVVRSMISEVRAKTDPVPANDTKTVS